MVTIDLRIDYLRPAFRGENVRARCECTKLTKRIAFTRGTAFVEDKPIAYSAGTFMIGV
jgi:acyl-coenzyme A thioesterase PaaI-like protein